jgi:hypothetical protein
MPRVAATQQRPRGYWDLALASIVSFTLMAEVERRRQLVYHTGRLSPIGERV